jgi:hypothetical protein
MMVGYISFKRLNQIVRRYSTSSSTAERQIFMNTFLETSCTNLSIDKKASLIEQHEKHIKDFRLLTLPGFTDDNDIRLGSTNHEPGEQDYSKKYLNEFLMTHLAKF